MNDHDAIVYLKGRLAYQTETIMFNKIMSDKWKYILYNSKKTRSKK